MPADDFVQCLTEVPGQIPTTKLFARGDFNSPKQDIAPGELTVLNAQGFTIASDDPQLPTSGRRLAYARHLTDGHHPLVARVLVNRFWLHHFGRGLVATPADFGILGEPPSHPELLDWLADDFMAGGWKLKRLQRMIVTSTAYRQSSQHRAELDAVDPDNRLLGRMRVATARSRDASRRTAGHFRPAVRQDVRPARADHARRRGADRGRRRHPRFGRPAHGQGGGPGRGRIPPQHLRAGAAIEAAGHAGTVRRAHDDAQLRATREFDQRPAVADADEQRLRAATSRCDGRANRAGSRRRSGRAIPAGLAVGLLPRAIREPVAGRRRISRRASRDHRCQPASRTRKPSRPHRRTVALSNLCQALVISNGFLYVD